MVALTGFLGLLAVVLVSWSFLKAVGIAGILLWLKNNPFVAIVVGFLIFIYFMKKKK